MTNIFHSYVHSRTKEQIEKYSKMYLEATQTPTIINLTIISIIVVCLLLLITIYFTVKDKRQSNFNSSSVPITFSNSVQGGGSTLKIISINDLKNLDNLWMLVLRQELSFLLIRQIQSTVSHVETTEQEQMACDFLKKLIHPDLSPKKLFELIEKNRANDLLREWVAYGEIFLNMDTGIYKGFNHELLSNEKFNYKDLKKINFNPKVPKNIHDIIVKHKKWIDPPVVQTTGKVAYIGGWSAS
jgi:hypothetical protein